MLRDFAKEAEEAERQRVLALAREDLNKELDAALTDLHQEANKNPTRESFPVTRTLARFGSLLGVLSRQASDQADKAENVSRQNLAVQAAMLKVTRLLFYLSIGLAVVAIAQIVLGYLQLKASKLQNGATNQAHNYKADATQTPLQTPVERPTQH